ncbi:MAG: NTP transferase domain-containing protein [Candidatus Pacebacteria bacterium]|nr:NTP transferase domain-containing protein [Candidatus Paceibacterota bacterium]
MKGVILAGGNGTRLHPLTAVTNKHLLPLYNKPVIYHPIEKLVSAGIDRIMIVTSPHHINDFTSLLGSGQNFISKRTGKQIQIVYAIQNKPSGIADGLYFAKDYVGNDNVVLYLGDNIIEDDITPHIRSFKTGAKVFLKEVPDPKRFGIATVDNDMLVTKIVEKPEKPESDFAVVGLYMYDNTVFNKMIGMKQSVRGEYEITTVNNRYIDEGTLSALILKKEWFDIGTFDSMLHAGNYMKKKYEK